MVRLNIEEVLRVCYPLDLPVCLYAAHDMSLSQGPQQTKPGQTVEAEPHC